MEKLEAANEVLKCFTENTHIEKKHNHWCVAWENSTGSFSKRWMVRKGQSFYPVWHHSWGHGGTATTALAQLVRWLKGQPVLSIKTWEYWAGQRVRLYDSMKPVEILRAAGYPEDNICVLCNNVVAKDLDWWCLKKISGPCCGWKTGCRQEIKN